MTLNIIPKGSRLDVTDVEDIFLLIDRIECKSIEERKIYRKHLLYILGITNAIDKFDIVINNEIQEALRLWLKLLR